MNREEKRLQEQTIEEENYQRLLNEACILHAIAEVKAIEAEAMAIEAKARAIEAKARAIEAKARTIEAEALLSAHKIRTEITI